MSTSQRDVARMLTSYSRPTLEAWAQARGLDPQRLRGPALLQQELSRVLLSPTALKAALAKSTPEERTALARIKLEGGKVQGGELTAQLVIDGVDDPDATLTSLMSRGLLFYDRALENYYGRWELWEKQSQQPYCPPLWLPRELNELIALPDDLGHLPLEAADEPSRVREGSFAMLQRDMYLLLQAIRENPVKLLKSGDVSKRDWERVRKILPAAGGGENDPTSKARAEGTWFRFLWFLIQRAGLLHEEAGKLTVSPGGLQFLGLNEGQQALLLLRAWANMVEWSEFARVPTLEFDLPGWDDASSGAAAMLEFAMYSFGDVPSPPQLVMARLFLMELILRQRPYPGWHSVPSLLASMKRYRVNFLIPRSNRTAYMAWGGGAGAQQDRRYHGFRARDGGAEGAGNRSAATQGGGALPRYFDKDRDWEEVEGGYLRTLLEEPLLWLGAIRLGYANDELVSFEITERGAVAIGLIEAPAASAPPAGAREEGRDTGERALVVQPNFEVVVYPEVAGIPLLVELDRFAERVRMDRAALYRLTRADLCRGLQEGLTLAEITRTLESANAGPLPQNVAYSLQEWEHLFNRIQVRRSVTLIEAADDAELRDLRKVPGLEKAREIARRVLLVPEGAALRGLRRTEIVDYRRPIVDAVEFETATRLRVLPGAATSRLLHRLQQIADRVEVADYHEDTETRKQGDTETPKGRRKGARGAIAAFASALSASPVSPHAPGEAAAIQFELNREKVGKAARWWRWEAMQAFLVAAAKAKPPAELEVILKGWAGQLAPAGLSSVTLLAAPGADWLDQVMKVPALKRLIFHRLSTTLALVTEENRPRLEEELATIGVTTGAGASLGDLVAAATKADAEAGEFLLVGPPRKRRALIEQAISLRRRLIIAEASYNARLTQTKVDPLRIEGEGASAALIARIDGYRYEQRYALNRIHGVRMLDEQIKP